MIHLLWCTIRPEQFKNAYTEWINNCENPDNVYTHLAVNTLDDKNKLEPYIKNGEVISVDTDRIGVCYPSYRLSSSLKDLDDNDIIVFASDDFISPSKWDRYLIDKLKDKKGTLIVRDGYQALDFSNMLYPCVTIPIMTYSCLKELNMIIYNQVYNHMFSDNELYLNLKEMNLLIDDRIADTTTFKHMHHSTGDRSADMCDHVYYSKWADDKTMWEKRRLLTLNERLK